MTTILIGFLGLALGSFVNALVWRLRELDLRAQSLVIKKHKKLRRSKQDTTAKELSILHGRSMCVHCKHTLAWFDLIPVLSWVMLRGRCRYCTKAISWQYPLIEILVGILALFSAFYWPFAVSSWAEVSLLVVWVFALAPMTALVIYDIRWMEMPTKLIYALDVLAVLFVFLQAIAIGSWGPVASGIAGSLLLGGFFWLLYRFSDGKWIGGGDVRFGFAMGLLLGWQSMLFGLMLASYLGVLVIIVLIAIKRYHRKMRIPFGPFLVAATYVAMLFGQQVVDMYKNLAGFG